MVVLFCNNCNFGGFFRIGNDFFKGFFAFTPVNTRKIPYLCARIQEYLSKLPYINIYTY